MTRTSIRYVPVGPGPGTASPEAGLGPKRSPAPAFYSGHTRPRVARPRRRRRRQPWLAGLFEPPRHLEKIGRQESERVHPNGCATHSLAILFLIPPAPLLRPPLRRCISIRQDWLYPPAPACLLACPLLRWPPPRLVVCLEPALPCLILKLYLPLALTHTHTRPHKHPHPHHTNAPALLASARLALIVRIVSGFLGILRLPFYLTLRVAGVPVSADTTRRRF